MDKDMVYNRCMDDPDPFLILFAYI